MMNSLIQILFVKRYNGFADESQVYSFTLPCGFLWRKKKRSKLSYLFYIFSYFKWFGWIPNLLSESHILF